MRRTTVLGRFASRTTDRKRAARPEYFHPHLEPLEERQLLTVNDLLVTTYDDTHGQSVLRINETTLTPTLGSVASLNASQGNLATAQGLAVAPDGTFYVSNDNTGDVDHFDRAGKFLGVLGHNVVFAPGTLKFGSNGHLYVGDLATNSIYEFNTASPTTPVSSKFLGYAPAGFEFVAASPSPDLIVGGLFTQTVTRYHSDASPDTVLIAPASNINPGVILVEDATHLLIADFDLGFQPFNHHQVVRYNLTTTAISQVVNLSQPVGTGDHAGFPAQPTSLLFDNDGNLLIGLSPDHYGNGAIQKYNFTTTNLTTLVTNIGTPSGLAYIAPVHGDIVASLYDTSAGKNVLRYNDATFAPAPGTVPFEDPLQGNLSSAQGVAVAPDGTFYVSNDHTGDVSHYDVSGNFMNSLGTGALYAPGTLVFGPNGHLYVGDLGLNSILQFDTAAPATPVGSLALGYAPAGFAFLPAYPAPDLIVGALFNQTVMKYPGGAGPAAPLITAASNINPGVILPEADGNLLIADFDLGFSPFAHHQLLRYNTTTTAITQLFDFDQPEGTGDHLGFPAQPTSMMYDHDGNLLVGLSPDHYGNAAIVRYNFALDQITTLASNLGTVSGLALVAAVPSTLEGRQLFYNNSAFDGASAAINASDDSAIATDKTAYLPNGSTAVFDNVSSYNKGINGIMIDLKGATSSSLINASDFVFKVGADNTPSGWSTAPAPSSISVRTGAGVSGSDRVEIVWGANAVKNQWLEVQVLATANTGLAVADVFFWGSRLGDTGAPSATDFSTTVAGDGGTILAGLGASTGITNVRDIDRTNSVTVAGDRGVTLANLGTLNRLNVGTAGPFAPVPAAALTAGPAAVTSVSPAGTPSAESGIASALTGPSPGGGSSSSVPAWLGHRLQSLRADSGPIANYFRQLPGSDTPRSRGALAKAQDVAETWGLDDELVESLARSFGSRTR